MPRRLPRADQVAEGADANRIGPTMKGVIVNADGDAVQRRLDHLVRVLDEPDRLARPVAGLVARSVIWLSPARKADAGIVTASLIWFFPFSSQTLKR